MTIKARKLGDPLSTAEQKFISAGGSVRYGVHFNPQGPAQLNGLVWMSYSGRTRATRSLGQCLDALEITIKD